MSQLTRTSGLLLILMVCSPRLHPQSPPAFVKIQSRRIHVKVRGHGKPPVIFESGLGEDLSTWETVQPEIAKSTLTLSYDRSGIGLSTPSDREPSGKELILELHELLQAEELPPPYILVGHSLGGTLVQIFARRYPDEVAGLVLVDPEDGRLIEQLKARLSPHEWDERSKALAKFGAMPAPVQREYDAMLRSGPEVEALGPLPKVPIVLISGTQIDKSFPGNRLEQKIKLQLHRQFLGQNPQTEQVFAPESRHYIQQDAPNKVIEAALRILAQTKK